MKTTFKHSKFHIIVSLVALFLVLCSVVGYVGAKYMKEVPLSGSVTFTADLAQSLELFEHKAVRNSSTGEYVLDMNTEVDSNSYTLIPGLDVPKDPTVRVTGKSSIEAFLYVEITDTLNGVTYVMSNDWHLLDIPERTVYVYTGTADTPMILDETTGDKEIKLIDNDVFTITDQIKSKTAEQTITFHAYLFQLSDGADNTMESAVTVFKTALSIT